MNSVCDQIIKQSIIEDKPLRIALEKVTEHLKCVCFRNHMINRENILTIMQLKMLFKQKFTLLLLIDAYIVTSFEFFRNTLLSTFVKCDFHISLRKIYLYNLHNIYQ